MVIEKKRYVFNNYFRSEKKGVRLRQVEVFAETILEAKKMVKGMGCDDLFFDRIVIVYERIR